MSMTKVFRNQHDVIMKIVSEICAHLDVDKLSIDASEVRDLLSALFGALTVHLSMEDKSLYPDLLKHSDEGIRSMAKKFVDEMGGIAGAVTTYKKKWPSDLEIQKNPGEFIAQTEGLFLALETRINKENNELYKAVDNI